MCVEELERPPLISSIDRIAFLATRHAFHPQLGLYLPSPRWSLLRQKETTRIAAELAALGLQGVVSLEQDNAPSGGTQYVGVLLDELRRRGVPIDHCKVDSIADPPLRWVEMFAARRAIEAAFFLEHGVPLPAAPISKRLAWLNDPGAHLCLDSPLLIDSASRVPSSLLTSLLSYRDNARMTLVVGSWSAVSSVRLALQTEGEINAWRPQRTEPHDHSVACDDSNCSMAST